MKRIQARKVYVNQVPQWECPICAARFAAQFMDLADAHARRCRLLHR